MATDKVENLIAGLTRVRDGLCCYAPSSPTCDCKYGFNNGPGLTTAAGGEHTGCPEIRETIAFLTSLRGLFEGDLLLTWENWSAANAALEKTRSTRESHRQPWGPR